MTMLTGILNHIIGLKVNEVISGGSNGSILLIKFGDEEAKYTILISCTWRLQALNTVLAGWNDSSDSKHGNLTIQTKLLENDYVESIEINKFYDLDITFKTRKTLKVFCDITPLAEFDNSENWYFANLQENKCFIVNKEFKIVEKPYR